MRKLLLVVALLSACMLSTAFAKDYPYGYPSTARSKQLINSDWKFKLGSPDSEFFKTDTDDSKWEDVSVPHTLKLTSIWLDNCEDDKTQLTFQRDVGWYRKTLPPVQKGKKTFIEFEGVHQVATVWVNGKQVGIHKTGGYTPFVFDVTDYVNSDSPNQVTILADNRRSEVTPPDPGPFDYVKFSGLYRDLYLVQTDKLHITSNLDSRNSGVTITTPSLDFVNGNATIDIATEVKNESASPRTVDVVNRVVDKEGNVVLKLKESGVVPANGVYSFNQIGVIEDNMHFWSVESPYLYKVNTTVYENGKAVDTVDNTFGARKFELDNTRGFLLNGKPIEIVGFNRHQHYGYIGDALPDSLHYKDVLQLKKLGTNCIRTAHYPQDDALIKACDELGMLIYEEAPTWISISQKQEWYDNLYDAARAMVRNHKNHPSVVFWGAGINHRGYVAQLHCVIKQEDPTRLTASQSSRWTGWQGSGVTDVFANMNYSDGIWEREEPLFAMEGRHGPEVIAKYKRDPMLTGMLSWTAHAYYSFHRAVYSGYENEKIMGRTRLGVMTVFRYLKDGQAFWYPSEFSVIPYIAAPEDWTKDNSSKFTIYSNADEIELVLNGKSLGKFYPSAATKYIGLSHPPYEIDVKKYEDGKLEIIGYNEGNRTCSKTIFTPKSASAIRLLPDMDGRTLVADGSDIVAVHAEIIDENGMIIKNFEGNVKLVIDSGDATVIGDGANIEANPFKAKYGVASFLVKAGKKSGKIVMTASCDGLKSANASVESIKAPTNDMVLRNAYPIYDTQKTLIDIGGIGQLLQFGWQPWNGEENSSSCTIDGYDFSIAPISEDGILRWLGEMNVIGKRGFVYSDGMLGMDKKGVVLTIKNLSKGNYVLRTYHHAPSSNTNNMDPNLEKLKKESIHKLPYAKKICASVGDSSDTVTITEGKALQYDQPAISEVEFSAKKDGDSVEVKYTPVGSTHGVWINGFELIKKL